MKDEGKNPCHIERKNVKFVEFSLVKFSSALVLLGKDEFEPCRKVTVNEIMEVGPSLLTILIELMTQSECVDAISSLNEARLRSIAGDVGFSHNPLWRFHFV